MHICAGNTSGSRISARVLECCTFCDMMHAHLHTKGITNTIARLTHPCCLVLEGVMENSDMTGWMGTKPCAFNQVPPVPAPCTCCKVLLLVAHDIGSRRVYVCLPRCLVHFHQPPLGLWVHRQVQHRMPKLMHKDALAGIKPAKCGGRDA